jgi:hypothetical protein
MRTYWAAGIGKGVTVETLLCIEPRFAEQSTLCAQPGSLALLYSGSGPEPSELTSQRLTAHLEKTMKVHRELVFSNGTKKTFVAAKCCII